MFASPEQPGNNCWDQMLSALSVTERERLEVLMKKKKKLTDALIKQDLKSHL